MYRLFTATWCSACKNLKNTLKQLDFEVQEVDIDSMEGMDLARTKGIRAIPVLENTETGDMIAGNVTSKQIEDFLKTCGPSGCKI